MAKKQTFSDKTAKVKGAGMKHCPVCDEIQVPTKVRSMQMIEGRMKNTFKMEKVCKCNSSAIFG